jgi:hypothetical protein
MTRPRERGDLEIHPVAAAHHFERFLALLGMTWQGPVAEAAAVGFI